MMSKTLLSLSLPFILFAQTVVVPDNYQITEDKDNSYIYSNEYTHILPNIKSYHHKVIEQYSSEFGFKLDDKLRTGLASNNNQIANGYSTQIPFNSQLFYGAGASEIDYFCTNSWLKTLILHETAHNFQLNPKENKPSWLTHKVVGNTPVTFLGFFPLFPIPNIMINSFVLEGNSVLNESRFGIGGRLYSGYALAEVVAMAKANKIRPEFMYNQTLDFPYGEKAYLIGGFFQKFLVQKYGAKKVNGYFKTYSKQIFPFFTNSAFKEQFGKSFETLLAEFVEDIKSKYSNFHTTKGKEIAKSKLFVPMNVTDSQIYTLISDYKSYPKILEFDKKSKQVTFNRGAYRVGEPFKIDGKYYTSSSVKVSPTKIKMGLVDSDAYMLDSSEGKAIQGFLSDGKVVYFDIEKSIDTPNIYIDEKFYDNSSSSIFIKGNDLYYFKQNGHKRTLYKNKKSLFDYSGYYGFVTDIGADGVVYFISLSSNGTTAYSYQNGKIKRVTEGDDVIEFKLINSKEALVATIGADRYKYQIIKLAPTPANIPAPDYSLEEQNSKITQSSYPFKPQNSKLDSKEYYPLTNLEYSSLDQAIGYGSYEGFILNLKANFSDPLMQNSMSLIVSTDKQRTVGGVSYNNTAHQLEFGGVGYIVTHNNDYNSSYERESGYSAFMQLPLVSKGYWRVSTTLDYTKDFENIYRKPLSLSLDISNSKQFGVSKYPNSINAFDIFVSQDRGENSYGASYSWGYGLPWQTFISLDATYMKSNTINQYIEKGIEINNNFGDIQSEKASISMPTIENNLYAKEVKVAEVGLYKTIDTPLYFFSFPLSLQRESLYLKQRVYNIDFADENRVYNETTLGLESDFVFFNNFELPIKFEFLYNQNVKDQTQFRVLLGGKF